MLDAFGQPGRRSAKAGVAIAFGMLGVIGVIGALGCGSFGADPPPAAEGDAGPDGPADVSTTDADADAGDAGADADEMVTVGKFRIDRTEVTNAQYDAFLEAVAPDAAGQHMYCRFNDTFKRDCTNPPALAPQKPVTCIDWCDAWAYCRWAGKRLCGAVDGSDLPPTSFDDPTKSQWMRACGGLGGQTYPYGSNVKPNACRTAEGSVDGGPAAVPTGPSCEGNAPGLFDMAGNVGEWEDACDLAGSSDVNLCPVRGGSFRDPAAKTACATPRQAARGSHADDVGFRCCAP